MLRASRSARLRSSSGPVQWVELDKLPAAAPAPRWMIDGGRGPWLVDAAEHLVGVMLLLTLESSAAAR